MNPHTRKHHVITVHYGSAHSTRQLVSALTQCPNPPDTILVINHAKEAKLNLPRFTENSPSILHIQPNNNNGYAAGINTGLGVLLSRGANASDIVTCINNDLTLTPQSFLTVRGWWEANPEPALVSFATNQQNHQHSIGHINLFSGRTRLSASTTKHKQPAFWRLRYIHGAFMSAPFELYIDNHGLPEKFFMYWEDALFSRQVALKKYPLKTAPAVQAIHQPPTKTATNHKLYYLVRNGALFLEQDTPPPWRAYWFLANRLRWLYHTLKQPKQPTVTQALQDAIRRTTGPRPDTTELK